MRHIVHVLVVVSIVAAGSLASGCGDGCPEPRFEQPEIPDGVQSDADGDFVVVRWAASAGDVLPDDYYTTMELRETVEPIRAASVTAPRELRIELSSRLDDYLGSGRTVELTFAMDDTQAWTDCSHPGMADVYFAHLVLTFEPDGSLAASFSDVTVAAGACAAAGGGSARGPRGAAALVATLCVAWLVRARRRRRPARRE